MTLNLFLAKLLSRNIFVFWNNFAVTSERKTNTAIELFFASMKLTSFEKFLKKKCNHFSYLVNFMSYQ